MRRPDPSRPLTHTAAVDERGCVHNLAERLVVAAHGAARFARRLAADMARDPPTAACSPDGEGPMLRYESCPGELQRRRCASRGGDVHQQHGGVSLDLYQLGLIATSRKDRGELTATFQKQAPTGRREPVRPPAGAQ